MNTHHRGCKKQLAHGRGPTSYKMHDSDLVFRILSLNEGSTFLDLGCGPGDYSIHAAKLVGKHGQVYAVDQSSRMMDEVDRQASEHRLGNLLTLTQDMTDPIPLPEESVDTCLLSTSLHCLDFRSQAPAVFRELHRILKRDGVLAVLECKKEEMDFGPPLHMRISAGEIAELIDNNGYRQISYADLGVNYMVRFRKAPLPGAPNNPTPKEANQ